MPIKNLPILRTIIAKLSRVKQAGSFRDSADYWEKRYAKGGNSGRGSYATLAAYKARVLNAFVRENNISTIVEFGCGDGNQLGLSEYPLYTGLDVSVSAINKCREKFKDDPSKNFQLYKPSAYMDSSLKAELTLSLDVTYHLIEEDVYNAYLHDLFNTSQRFVIIYAWDVDGQRRGHVLHRKFSTWIEENKKEWVLIKINSDLPKDPQACDFFFYQKNNQITQSAT